MTHIREPTYVKGVDIIILLPCWIRLQRNQSLYKTVLKQFILFIRYVEANRDMKHFGECRVGVAKWLHTVLHLVL